MSRFTLRAALLAAVVVVQASCTLAPRYRRPDAPVAPSYPVSTSAIPGAPAAADLGWRDVLDDARLQAIVALALENNRDLRVAVLNVDRARAQYGIQRSALLPALDATASTVQQRTPGDLNGTGSALTTEQWSVGVGVTAFELDLFGRVRSLNAAALQRYLATEEARRSAHLAIVAAVANQYLAERAFDEQVALARQTLETVTSSYELTRRSAEVGRTSELDLRTAEAQLQTARFNLSVYEQQRAQADNAMALLVGGPIPADLPPPAPLAVQDVRAALPAGLPSDLLQRRPDVLQAEHELRAANANIGAARAAFFPSITLTGSGGTASAELDGLFGAGSGAWSFVPRVNLPLFAGGRNRANLGVANADRAIGVARYEKAIQVAFREVADGLVARGKLDEQLAAQAARVAAETQRFALSDLRYRKGVDSYVTVLTAQRDLYGAQQLLIQTQLARLSNLIGLYKALGGGWVEQSARAAAAPVN
jgi:outer membrane protein, multidrug efflux system